MNAAPEPRQVPHVNVADRLTELAQQRPGDIAIAAAKRRGYQQITFAELDRNATLISKGLVTMGVEPGQRMALLVKPGVEFVTLVFALLRSGATMVLVDAGLGKRNIVRCLQSTQPDGFVGIPQAQLLRVLLRPYFPNAKLNVTVGKQWCWGGETVDSLKKHGTSTPRAGAKNDILPRTTADDPAAIVFTSGSTGPPKGVLYRHQTFVTQADEIQRQYKLESGGVDLACFPLFGLFNVACGMTTVLPAMDFSRPASCNPKKLLRAANDWKVNQAFASPAVWDRLSRHAQKTGDRIPSLKTVFSCGAPVPAKVIRRTLAMVHPQAELHTPYGATEALPVATIEAQEILNETANRTDQGAGVCVGTKFDSIDWRVIRITDDPIAAIDQTEELPPGEIGELIVRGPQVSLKYLDSKPESPAHSEPKASMHSDPKAAMHSDPKASAHSEPKASAPGVFQGGKRENKHHNRLAKITDGDTVWHRMGDVGYLDDQCRFWYCGRKSHRVRHRNGDLFTERIENAVNTIPNVEKSALVDVDHRPVLVVQQHSRADAGLTCKEWVDTDPQIENLWYGNGSSNEAGKSFTELPVVLIYKQALPTDIRHNSKINREKLAIWAAKRLKKCARKRGRHLQL